MPHPVIRLAAIVLAAIPILACAADAPARNYRIEAGPLGPALGRFAAASGVTLSFDPALARAAGQGPGWRLHGASRLRGPARGQRPGSA